MPTFLMLTRSGREPRDIAINMNLVTSIVRYDSGSGYTSLTFDREHAINVLETPHEILGRLPVR